MFRPGLWCKPLAAVLLSLLSAAVAHAHVPIVHGRLVDLVARSDLVVIGTVQGVNPVSARFVDTQIKIEQVVVGTALQKPVTFRGPTRFAPGERYVFFLRRAGSGLESLQASGTVFPATPADDAAYRHAVLGVRRALHLDPSLQAGGMLQALIPALSAGAPPLRYHAALEIGALTEHGHELSPAERQAVQRLLADAATDPVLRPLLAHLVRQGGTPP